MNFTKEYYSVYYANTILNKVWNQAAQLGYAHVFKNIEAGAVMDDHYYINRDANIPTIDLIHYFEGSSAGFFPHWHTTNDNMDAIDPNSLNIVGSVVLEVIYREK